VTRNSRSHIEELMAIDKSAMPENGGERFNRLIFARSPYLLQHSENPVDWYEWGEAAFTKARNENKPIFLSIGYATCHWCHVMAHESFEDREVAEVLNSNFVCIKVDREERPDIDDFYMTVSQMLTGSGGWPLNIFAAPDKHPFMAITYLPKQGRGGMSGLMELLANIASIWDQRPDMIEKNCNSIMKELGSHRDFRQPEAKEIALRDLEHLAFQQLSGLYDPVRGGFGTAPKFPMPIYLSWLIGQGARGNAKAMEMAKQTLQQMRSGGIWDQLGGGVHRYAVDGEWLVPHFEKMLYDQALVALAALEAFQCSGDDFFLRMADDIFCFVEGDLLSPGAGAFCSALDADSEGVEGKFYVWAKKEIDDCLGEDAPLFDNFYDITESGNFEGHTILNIPDWLNDFCTRERVDPELTGQTLERCRKLLLDRREKRIPPFRDNKIVTAWNGMMIAALARGGVINGMREYTEGAVRAASFVLENLRRKDGRLLRSFRGEASDIPAFLEDYAFLMFGLLELFEATLDKVWLEQSLQLADQTLALFHLPDSGRFSKIGKDAEQMAVNMSLDQDGVIPSPFSTTATMFIRLGRAAGRPDLLDHARTLLQGSLGEAQRQPMGHLGTLQAMAMLENEPLEAHFRGSREHPDMRLLLQQLKSRYIPNLTLFFEQHDCAPSVSICARRTCHPPVGTIAELDEILCRYTPCRTTTP
jgi:uncharacterized protein YyaL (SSP411 family)